MHSPWMTSRVRAVACAGMLAAAAPSLPVRAEPAATRAALPEFVQLELADSLGDQRELVRRWVSDGVIEGLGEAKVQAETGGRTLAVEVAGSAEEYDLVIGVRSGDAWIGRPRRHHCVCLPDDLVAKVRAEVVAVAPGLEAEDGGAQTPAVSAPDRVTPAPAVDATENRKRLAPLGVAGIVTTVGGAALLAAGIGVVLADTDFEGDPDDLDQRRRADLRVPGGVVAAVGAAGVIAGITMLAVNARRSKKRSVELAPSAYRRGGGMVLRVAF